MSATWLKEQVTVTRDDGQEYTITRWVDEKRSVRVYRDPESIENLKMAWVLSDAENWA